MRKLEYRKRQQTLFIYICVSGSSTGSFVELYRNERAKGNYDTGYHYYIDILGNVVEDRQKDSIANATFEEFDRAIYILCEAVKKPNDCQAISLQELLECLKGEYKNVEVIKNYKSK